MNDSQPPIENWQGMNVKGGQNDIHDNQFVKQQGIIANDQATIHIGKVEQHFATPQPLPSPIAMIKILFLSAQPRNLNPLRLDEEKRDIEQGLERAKHRDRFVLVKKEAVRRRDFQRAMLDEQPQIVHFSGHGGGDRGLALEDESGNLATVSAEALTKLFQLFETVDCVVLNACYSEVQAEAIKQVIPYVVGMNDAIGDRAAIEFAVAFYDALGAGKDVPFAFKYACAAIELASLPESHKPVLLKNEDLISAKKP
jgi:hypothetical protein